MEKKVVRLYWIFAGILLGIILLVGCSFRYDLTMDRMDDGYRILNAKQTETETGNTAPYDVAVEYSLYVPEIQNGRQELAFYSVHQSVEVAIDGVQVYAMFPAEENAFGKTPGHAWNFIPLTDGDVGKEIKITITSPYKSNLYLEPVFYFGEKSTIVLSQLLQELPPLGLAILTFLGGILLIGFVVYTCKDSRVDKSLIHLGIFAVLIALWQFFDLHCSSIFFPYSLVTCYFPFLVLMLLPVPFVMFVRHMHKSKNHPLWGIMCGISFVNIVVNTLLQVTDIADFKETLWITHLTFGLVIGMGIFMLIREWRSVGLSPRLRLNMICVVACAIGSFIDLVFYYLTSGASVMICGLTGFLVYVMVFGASSVVEAKHLMAIGKEAEKFEKMAYHDQLTGLYNRLAWVDMVKKVGEHPEEYMVIMLDLNDLKRCNDSLGHDCGDRYITESAKIIEKSFGRQGNCFRMGGDEFCVLFHSTKVEDYMECMDRMQESIKNYNAENGNFVIQIAYGAASFDKSLDYDLNDTRSRADAAMYHRKFKMKSGEE